MNTKKTQDRNKYGKSGILNIFRPTKLKIVSAIIVVGIVLLFFFQGDNLFCEETPDDGIPKGWMLSNECSMVYIWITIVLYFLFLPVILIETTTKGVISNFFDSDVFVLITFLIISCLYVYFIVCITLFLISRIGGKIKK